MVKRTFRNCYSIDKEIKILREVTNLAQKLDNGKRILYIAEVIYFNSKEFSSKTAFNNVAIVLKPITPQTFGDLVGT